jgi:mannose-6-phosphate isomerase-like protein (cupin superfamily)
MTHSELPHFDSATFSNNSHVKKVIKPWGYELHWTPENKPYMGKILHINEGARLSLQAHDKKQESWMIINGRAKVIWDDSTQNLVETELQPLRGYSCELGQRHRLVGITECDVLEVSTPEIGITFRLDDDYARPDETEEQRAIERAEQ